MGLDRKRVGLAASNFSPEELQGQAMQAIAALLLHHKLTINTIVEALQINPAAAMAEAVAQGGDPDSLLKVLLQWHEDYVDLKRAGDLIKSICPHYQSPPKDAIDRAIADMGD